MSVYEELGLRPIINACGSVTRLGGAPMPPAALQAFIAAAEDWVPLDELQAAACRVIAEVTGAEAGLVTSGAASALTLGAAAILTGQDLGRMERLPDCTGFPHEFVVAREQRNGYDHAVRAAGARFVEVGFHELVAGSGVRRVEAWEYDAAFTSQTAGVFYVYGLDARPPLSEVAARAHARNLPVLVDAAGELPPRSNLRDILAAGELPPRSNLRDILAAGADLVAFSGGKAIRGPQATGILCGRRDLIAAAMLQMLDTDDHYELWEPPEAFVDRRRLPGIPRQGIGRAMKVSKEQIVALLTALRLFASGAYDRELPDMRRRLEQVAAALEGRPARSRLHVPADGQSAPVLEIALDETALGRTALEVCHRLRRGDPPIQVGHALLSEGKLIIHPLCLKDEQTTPLARRLREELTP